VRNRFLILVILVAMLAVPVLAARDPSSVRGLRRAALLWFLSVLGYAFGLGWLYVI